MGKNINVFDNIMVLFVILLRFLLNTITHKVNKGKVENKISTVYKAWIKYFSIPFYLTK